MSNLEFVSSDEEEEVAPKPIRFFSSSGTYYELSNYYPSPINVNGITYPTVEHFYQAHKYLHPYDATPLQKEYAKLIAKASTPNKAKFLANQKGVSQHAHKWYLSSDDNRLLIDIINEYNRKGLKMREDWEDVKVDVMKQGLWFKFTSHPKLRKLLLETGDAPIEEDSPTDMFWGRRGKNMLGLALESIRRELKELE